MDVKAKTKTNYLNQESEHITGCEALVRSLIAEGVDIIYGYPGGAPPG